MKFNKPALSFDAQLAKLQGRGLLIAGEREMRIAESMEHVGKLVEKKA